MFNRFTERAKRVVMMAKEEATRMNHPQVGTEHILLGLLRVGSGVALAVIEKLGIDSKKIRVEIEKKAQTGSPILILGEMPLSPQAKRVLEFAMEEASALEHNYVGTEHIFLGLIREKEGIAAQVLEQMGLNLEKVRAEIMGLLGGEPLGTTAAHAGSGGAEAKTKTPALDAFGTNLTKLAIDGKLDPVIGRKDEIERVIHVLSRRKKNNPVLLGDAGVGKTAIVEGLGQQIVAGNVPDSIKGRRLITLDLASMVAGTKYRGQFEERIKAVMSEIKKSDDVILFIDEIHNLVGAGAAEGAIDASSILKPALARGDIQCIGATTVDEYRKYIEKDAALERRFQTIMVEAPSVKETIEILKGLRDKYEAYHRVRILDEALEAAAKLSDRYITDRFLPDKAIDVIDEAGAKVRLSVTTAPLDVKKLEKQLDEVRKEKESAVKTQDFEKAAQLRDQEKKLKAELSNQQKDWNQSNKKASAVVTTEVIAEIVSKWTGVPVQRLQEAEAKKLLKMEEALHKRIIGQDEPIESISRAIRRSRSGLKDPKRPVGSFIFLGPTGVGKTELAKTLAEFLFGDRDALIRLDMSEYMEKFAVSRLIGAPPGYVGYEEGGQLTEKVRRRPYSVVLLDEIEKAHPDVFNILLQVFDDGRLTDSLNHTVDFRNTVLIMTSNIGTRDIKRGSLGFRSSDEKLTYEKTKSKLMSEVKQVFRPEFLNRLDEVIVFHELTKDELKKIVDLMLSDVYSRLESDRIKLHIASQVKDFLIEKGYDPVYGARPLQRAIQRYIEDPLSEEMLRNKISKGSIIEVVQKGDKLDFNIKKREAAKNTRNKG
ncbi:MAG: ATP-dependent Clp protease ATP-binding subunit [bacterium]|nr:ATP-dependent Clp protease ATP-binding subunit [bacterium]